MLLRECADAVDDHKVRIGAATCSGVYGSPRRSGSSLVLEDGRPHLYRADSTEFKTGIGNGRVGTYEQS
jgi:hypothetical protein